MNQALSHIIIRDIQPEDNQAIAVVIRNTLAEFGANHPGTVYYDDTTDHLYELFRTQGSRYFIAASGGKIVGGAGIYPTENLPPFTCELVKMYLIPEARGGGLGTQMIRLCLQTAKESGYRQVYLETMPELKKALSVYERMGFRYLNVPMGNSGHFGCDLWMLKNLEEEYV